MRRRSAPQLRIEEMVAWAELMDFLEETRRLRQLRPEGVVDACPELIERAKGVLARVREDALLAATTGPSGKTQRVLARERGLQRSKVGEAVAAAKRRNGIDVRPRGRSGQGAPTDARADEE